MDVIALIGYNFTLWFNWNTYSNILVLHSIFLAMYSYKQSIVFNLKTLSVSKSFYTIFVFKVNGILGKENIYTYNCDTNKHEIEILLFFSFPALF